MMRSLSIMEHSVGQKVRAAVFPVAGRGTRFLPATKASPKEMLPIVDKPLIQYAVEEAIEAGATKLVFVTGSSKRAIEDHFDTDPELEQALNESGKDELLRSIQDIVPAGVTCIYIRKGNRWGLVMLFCALARPLVMRHSFVHLADDLIAGAPGCLAQMAAEYDDHGGSVVAVETVPHEHTSSYGIVAVDPVTEQNHGNRRKTCTGRCAIRLGSRRSLPACTRDIRQAREHWQRSRRRNSADRWHRAILSESAVYAYSFDGVRYDCGSKLGYLQATVAYGLSHPDTGEEFREHLRNVLSD